MGVEAQTIDVVSQRQYRPDMLTKHGETRSLFPLPLRVISAGDNSSRLDWLKKCFPQLADNGLVCNVAIGEESRDPHQSKVMRLKISSAYEILQQNNDVNPGDLFVGVDIRTYLPDKTQLFTSHGKPAMRKEVQGNFRLLLDDALTHNREPLYSIRSASGVLYVDNQKGPQYFEMEEVCQVRLNRGVLARLVEKSGFDDYVNAMKAFFPNPKKMMSSSAGFSLEVLLQLGAVESINGIEPMVNGQPNPLFMPILRRAIQLVAIGTSEELMNLFKGVNPEDVINNMPFLRDATDKAMQPVSSNTWLF